VGFYKWEPHTGHDDIDVLFTVLQVVLDPRDGCVVEYILVGLEYVITVQQTQYLPTHTHTSLHIYILLRDNLKMVYQFQSQ